MIVNSVKLVGTSFSAKDLLSDNMAKIVFLGRSNVGKSSLLNHLLSRRRIARTSSSPGKTVSVNYYLINNSFYFVDLPGYGYAKISKQEQKRVSHLMEDFFQGAKNIRLVLLLIDSRRGFLESDLAVIDKILEKNFKILTILTKSDKISYSKLIHQLKRFQNNYGLNPIPFSYKSKKGKDEICDYIDKALKE
jgi:GTP-binding protein